MTMGAFVMERMLDLLAERVGHDPAEDGAARSPSSRATATRSRRRAGCATTAGISRRRWSTCCGGRRRLRGAAPRAGGARRGPSRSGSASRARGQRVTGPRRQAGRGSHRHRWTDRPRSSPDRRRPRCRKDDARCRAGTLDRRRFQRIQFTSDLLPSDIIGVSVYQPDRSEFVFKPGPLFTNVVLADEINRTTPKTQSSLLEAMNEAQVSLDHTTVSAAATVHGPRDAESARVRGHASAAGIAARSLPAAHRASAIPAWATKRRSSAAESTRASSTGSSRCSPPTTSCGCRTKPSASADRGVGARLPDGAGRGDPPVERLLALGVSPRGSLALLRARQGARADGRP